jgi:bifunctional DNA-binding transcriptional regulator/antitoxin component of YhaV-PrlF toxin-antitoxin module
MKATYQIQVGRRGVLTIPKKLRDQNEIADGEVFTLFELSEDVYVISRQLSRIDQVADRLAAEWRESGESLESMLATLREVRAEYGGKKP